MIDVNKILSIIKATRKELKISQEDMGKKIGVAKETYRDIENGKIGLKIEEYIRICKCLNISASQLLCFFDEQKYLYIPISDDEIQILKKVLNRISDDLDLLLKFQNTEFFINFENAEDSNIVIKSKIKKIKRMIDFHMKKLCETLRYLSNVQKKTQVELANYLGYSKGAVSQWYNGLTEPNIETVVRISKFFNVSLNYLLTGEEIDNDCIIIKKSKYKEIISKAKSLLDVIEDDLSEGEESSN